MIVIAIEDSKALSKLTVEEMMGYLLFDESRINMEEESLEHAFKTQAFIGRGRGKRNRGSRERGRGRRQRGRGVIKEKKKQHQNSQNNQIGLKNLEIRGEEAEDGHTNPNCNVTVENTVIMKANEKRNSHI
jgi:hypothetical protein